MIGKNKYVEEYMDKKWDKRYLSWGITVFLVILASLCCFVIIFKFDSVKSVLGDILKILKPVLYGLVIAYLLNPIMVFFEKLMLRLLAKSKKSLQKTKKIAHGLSVLLTVVVVILLLGIIFMIIIPNLLSSIFGIFENFQNYYKSLANWLDGILANNYQISEFIDGAFEDVYEFIQNWLSNVLMPQINNILSTVTSGAVNVLLGLKDIIIGFIISIYLLISKDMFIAQSKKIIYAVFKLERANWILETGRFTHKVFSGFTTGIIIDSTIVGFICFIFLSTFNMPFPLLISVLSGIANIIPVFGPYIGGIPSVILILLVDPVKCLYYILFIIVLQAIDGNIIAPKILGDATGLSSFWVIFSILFFGGIFGFIGMIAGVPTFAVIYSLIKVKVAKMLKSRNLPTKTIAYQNLDHINVETNKLINIPQIGNDKVDEKNGEKA